MKSIIKYVKPYFESKKTHPTSPNAPETQQQYILFTYRSGINKLLPTTYYTSDSGWGCMLRVGQMFIANIYYKSQKENLFSIIKLFHDNTMSPFSIQMFSETAAKLYPNKKINEWFSPCECGFILKQLIEKMDTNFRVNIFNDNSLFLDEIQSDSEKVIILLMCRIGLDEPQPQYRQCVSRLFKMKYFHSMLGGTPRKAHLFLKSVDGYFGFLDPHKTQKVPQYHQIQQNKNQFVSKLIWIKQKYIDSSMAIAFLLPSTEIMQFWQQMEAIKQEMGDKFFIYMAKQKPSYEEEGIIQLTDDF